MDLNKYANFKLELKDKILTATINRPEALNAIDNPTEKALISILQDGAMDDSKG